MKNIKQLLLSIFIGINTTPMYCQIIDQPSERQLKTYDSLVIKSMKIIEKNEADINPNIKQQLNEMLLELIEKRSIKFKEPKILLDIFEENKQLINIYKAGYIRYLQENKNSIDSFLAIKAGLISMIAANQRENEITKSSKMNTLLLANRNDKLDLFIKENFY